MITPKISVIVPVYNAEQYLYRCIDSILTQTFTDFELLLINDGSKDKSGAICDKYALRDSRVRIFHKENGGVSSARNVGLENAHGEWVVYVDSDDYVKKTYLNDLYEEMMECNADMVIQDFEFVKENGWIIERWYDPLKKIYYSDDIATMIKEQSLESRGYSVAKLFSLAIIKENNITYPLNVCFGEDSCFILRYLMHVKCVSCSAISNYCYIDHPTSAIHLKHDFKTEYLGYEYIRSAVFSLSKKYSFDNKLNEIILPWVAHFMHRAITVVRCKIELLSISDEDWTFFNTHFKGITRKTTIDKWVIRHFYKFPFILLPYLKFNVWLRNFIIKHNMHRLLDKLKK